MFLSLLHKQQLFKGIVTVSISQPCSKSSNWIAFFPTLHIPGTELGNFIHKPSKYQKEYKHTQNNYAYDLSEKENHTSQY